MSDALQKALALLADEGANLHAKLTTLTNENKSVYRERAQVLAVATKLAQHEGVRCGRGTHPAEDASWDQEWRTIVFLDLPTGQCSWHIHDSDVDLFRHLRTYEGQWDGHTTETKYQRCREFTLSAWGSALPTPMREIPTPAELRQEEIKRARDLFLTRSGTGETPTKLEIPLRDPRSLEQRVNELERRLEELEKRHEHLADQVQPAISANIRYT